MENLPVIVGMACRVPGANSPEAMWENLMAKRDNLRKLPKERFNIDSFYHPNGANKGTTNAPYGYTMDFPLDAFDAEFFGISGKEAEAMDPQQRLLLEVVYEALEDAGITLEEISGTQTSVYCGSLGNEYSSLVNQDWMHYPRHSATGQGGALLANRISYFYNCLGPSISIDTACSSSLVTLHMGSSSILSGESDISIVMGSSAVVGSGGPVMASDMSFLSADGRSRSFDAKGTGYGRGEGICVVILKRQRLAVRDGNDIRAVVRGTASNHIGKNAGKGITVPSAEAQEELIRKTYAAAGLDPDDTQYFEAHGTGTKVGDPIETRGIGAVFATPTRHTPLIMGSVKANIGHLEGSAGLAGVTKTVLALEKGVICPNMLFETPNPDIKFDEWKLRVPTTAIDWPIPRAGCPRRASCSSFGYGGANAHCILEAPAGAGLITNGAVNGTRLIAKYGNGTPVNGVIPEDESETDSGIESPPSKECSRPYLIPLTSHSAEAGKLTTKALMRYLKGTSSDNVSLEDISYSLSCKRSMHRQRAFAIGLDREQICAELQEPRPSASWGPTTSDSKKGTRLGFIFTGQGAATFDMGRQMINESTLFRSTLERCERILTTLPDGPEWSLMDEVLKPKDKSRISQPAFSQPICTALQLALVVVLKEWGIEPTALCGHSSGEIAAAYAAGHITFEAAMTIAFYRGKHMGRYEGVQGAMLAVGLGEKDAITELGPFDGRLDLAAVNSPASCTISGDADAIDELEKILSDRGVFARKLKVEQAFHSHHMRPLAPKYKAALEACHHIHRNKSPVRNNMKCRMFSSVTARVITDDTTWRPSYWADNMVRPVRFADALTGILLDEDENDVVDVLVEIGPHPALKGPSRQVVSSLKLSLPYVATLNRGQPAYESLLETAGVLFKQGFNVDLRAVNADQRLVHGVNEDVVQQVSASTPKRIKSLPSYSWNHKRYWAATRLTKQLLNNEHSHTLLGKIQLGTSDQSVVWRNFIRLSELPWLRDHVVDDSIVFPGAGYVTLAVEAALRMRGGPNNPIAKFMLRDLDIKAALTLRESETGSELLVNMKPQASAARGLSEEWIEFAISSYSEDGQNAEHCHGYIAVQYGEPKPLDTVKQYPTPAELAKECDWRVSDAQMYEFLADIGLPYGDTFRLVDGNIDLGGGSAVGKITYEPGRYAYPGHTEHTVIHPAVLDCAAHLDWMAGHTGGAADPVDVFIPRFFKAVEVSGLLVDPAFVGDKYEFLGTATSKRVSERAGTSSNIIWTSDGRDKLVEVRQKESTAMDLEGGGTVSRQGIFFQQRWEPCFDLLSDADRQSKDVLALLALYTSQHPSATILGLVSSTEEAAKLLEALRPSGNANQPLSCKSVCIHMPAATEDERRAAQAALGVEVGEPVDVYDLIVSTSSDEYDVSALCHDGTVLLVGQGSAGSVSVTSPAATLALSGEDFQGLTIVCDNRNPSSRVQAIAKELLTLSKDACVVKVGELDLTSISRNIVVLTSLDRDIESQADWLATRDLLGVEDRNIVWLHESAFMETANPTHARLAGLLRTARNENPQSRLVALDYDEATEPARVAKRIAQVLHPALKEDEIAVRAGSAYIPRLEEDIGRNSRMPKTPFHVSSRAPLPSTRETPVQLTIGKLGLLEALWFEPRPRQALQADYVEVKVMASALNFRDVAIGVGIIQDRDMGSECAGIITAVGADVHPANLKVGDRVFCQAKPTHATSVQAMARLCRRIPDDMSFVKAASFSTVITTGVYGLFNLGRLRKGETVLVHAAAGAVGQAAVQLAQRIGARVLATCSEPKREFLRKEFGLPDEAMFSSRNDSFVRGVLDATDGRGVDVVLNSLSGKLLEATWNVVAPFGRFIEIGKRDIHQDSFLPMAPFRQNVSFAAVDMITVFKHNAPLSNELLDECCRLAFSGEIKEPQTLIEFPFSQAEKAYRLLQMGKHVGKVILVPKEGEVVPMAPPSLPCFTTPLLDANKTYLLVGGLGGLGSLVAEWMHQAGARKFAFLSRSGNNTHDTLDWLRSKGDSVSTFKGSVAEFADVERVISAIGEDLGGIHHLAAVSRDSALRNMSYEDWDTCVKVKCHGAWNLHLATKDRKLDYFICFSSSSAVIGTPGQANYSAANAYLDGLMAWRRRQGLVGTSINVAGISEFLRLVEEAIRSDAQPQDSTSPALAPTAIKRLVTGLSVQSTSGLVAERSVMRTICARFDGGSDSSAGNSSQGLARMLAVTNDAEERAAILIQGFIDKIGAVLDVEVSSITTGSSLPSLGLDSIVAVELRRWFKDIVSIDLPLFDFLNEKPIDQLVTKAIGLMPKSAVSGVPDSKQPTAAVNGVTQEETVPDENGPALAVSRPILRLPADRSVPISAAQQRLWAFHQAYDEKWRMNISLTSKFSMEADTSIEASKELLRQCLTYQAMIHPVFRTAFVDHDSWVEQRILKEPVISLDVFDLRHKENVEQRLNNVISEHKHTKLDVTRGQVSSLTAVLLPNGECVMLTVVHHIILDASSAILTGRTFVDVLRALQKGEDPMTVVPTPRISYADFTAWHDDYLSSPEMESHRDFWRLHLADAPEVSPLLPFAIVKQRPSSFNADRARHRPRSGDLPQHLVQRMKRQSAAAGFTPFQFALAAFRAFLYRTSGDTGDLMIAMLDGSRPHADTADVAGYFVNALPLRLGVGGDGENNGGKSDEATVATSFKELVGSVANEVLVAMEHSVVPFSDIAHSLGRETQPGTAAVAQIAINYWKNADKQDFSAGAEGFEFEVDNISIGWDLSLEIVEKPEGGLELIVDHSLALYTASSMQKFTDDFAAFFCSVIRDQMMPVEVE